MTETLNKFSHYEIQIYVSNPSEDTSPPISSKWKLMQGKKRWTSAGEKEAEVVWAKSDGGLLYDWEGMADMYVSLTSWS